MGRYRPRPRLVSGSPVAALLLAFASGGRRNYKGVLGLISPMSLIEQPQSRGCGKGGSQPLPYGVLRASPVQFLLQSPAIVDSGFREQFLSAKPNPFSFVQRT